MATQRVDVRVLRRLVVYYTYRINPSKCKTSVHDLEQKVDF
jgi:hypothetical protein